MHCNRFAVFTCCIFLLSLFSCTDKFELPDQPLSAYTKVYMPLAVNNPKVYALQVADTMQAMIYSANYGGQDYPTEDIQVTFAPNTLLVDSFNTANHTTYLPMPEKSYTLSTTNGTIRKGTLGTGPLSIAVKTSGAGAIDIMKEYLLPVSIVSASTKINENLRTTFYRVRADYPVYDRTNWQVIGFSSQEANGEGAGNGKVINALDGNASTYWHSQWQGGSPGPPHFFVVDMGEVKTLHGFSFLDRQSDNSGKPQDVVIETSKDNTTWATVGSFTLANTKDLQTKVVSSFTDARYFKITVQSSYNASYTHLAELNAF
ncbi:discoidin domain-containing protein [Chitinophaga sp. RAB17]|uniref:discoidin domain-containing protein n=1 Tax=Chitinophaga sp. RAB17 TaxID=3233049 RepID=UPI003F920E39